MKLDYTHTYAAAPERVIALLRDPEFLADVARHAGALEHSSDVTPDAIRLRMRLPVPSQLTKFVGQSVQLQQVFRFEPPRDDDVIVGSVDVDVPGMPVDVNADAEMRPTPEGTTGSYTGDVKVKIPLVGKKVESLMEPFIREAFDGLERRAADWLSR